MNWRKGIWILGSSFAAMLVAPALARADNCGGLYDCWGTAAAAAAAAAGAGAAAAAGSHHTEDQDECQGEREAVQDLETQCDALRDLVNTFSQQLDQLRTQAASQVLQADTQGTAAAAESAANAALSSLVATLQAELQSIGDPAQLLGGNAPGVAGTSSADFFSQLGALMPTISGQAAAASGLGQTGPYPLTLTFLNTLMLLQALSAQGSAFANMLQEAQRNLQEAQNQLQNAQQALADCTSRVA